MDIFQTEACKIAKLIQKGSISAEEALQTFLDRIEKYDPDINSFIFVDKDGAIKAAREIDDKVRAGEALGSLAGVPIAIKDNICVKDLPTTAASKIIDNFISPYDAFVVERLREAGAIIIGKTNLDEFAMGGSGEFSSRGATKNPWDAARVPGGSSSGSAAAVAARLAPLALGSDTGGSIRQPASFTGCVGFKPTYGRVSRYGLLAFASSLDQIGPMANSVQDAALLLGVIAGHDNKDATSRIEPVEDYLANLTRDIKGLRIGVPNEYMTAGVHPEVLSQVKNAIRTLENLGAEIMEVGLPHAEYAMATYYIIADAEASSNLARYSGIHYGNRVERADLHETLKETRSHGFGPEVMRRILLGTFVLSSGYYDAYYDKARRAQVLINQDFEKAFEQVDVLVSPVVPRTAFKFGDKVSDPIAMYMMDVLTASANLAGLPAVSVPCGFDSKNLPIGLQIIGRRLDDSRLLNVAHVYESNRQEIHLLPSLQV